jgi:hypothetical protein
MQILSAAHAVLRRRGSARIIAIASARGDVRNLLTEYRNFISEAEKQLERDGVRVTATATNLFREAWRDTLIEHQRRAS